MWKWIPKLTGTTRLIIDTTNIKLWKYKCEFWIYKITSSDRVTYPFVSNEKGWMNTNTQMNQPLFLSDNSSRLVNCRIHTISFHSHGLGDLCCGFPGKQCQHCCCKLQSVHPCSIPGSDRILVFYKESEPSNAQTSVLRAPRKKITKTNVLFLCRVTFKWMSVPRRKMWNWNVHGGGPLILLCRWSGREGLGLVELTNGRTNERMHELALASTWINQRGKPGKRMTIWWWSWFDGRRVKNARNLGAPAHLL